MAFPASPTNGQQHTEGSVTYEYDSTGPAWEIVDLAGSGATNLSSSTTPTTVDVASSTGTDATIPAATASDAGAMTAADKSKLDAVEVGAAADQNAGEVSVTPSGNLAAADVQAALVELQGDIDNMSTISSENVITGNGAPAAGDGIDGDYYFDATSGDWYGPKAAGAWGASIGNAYAQLGVADATQGDNLTGAGGSATTAARSDHRHTQNRGAVFPATDGTAGIHHVLMGHATVPDGLYVLIEDAGASGVWVQA